MRRDRNHAPAAGGGTRRWFPIYWGWWYTGTDVNNKRAQALLDRLRKKDVEDSEIPFTASALRLGGRFLSRPPRKLRRRGELRHVALRRRPRPGQRHAVTAGTTPRSAACRIAGCPSGSPGHVASAVGSVTEACAWARESGHVGSIAHAYHNLAMLHCYRRDFPALSAAIADFRRLTAKHSLRSLAATFEIFEGWCIGNAGDLELGQEKIRKGLAVHAGLPDTRGLSRLLQHAWRADGSYRPGRGGAGAPVAGRGAGGTERAPLLAGGAAPSASATAGGGRGRGTRPSPLLSPGAWRLPTRRTQCRSCSMPSKPWFGMGVPAALETQYRPAVERARSMLERDAAAVVGPESVPARRRVVR